LLFLEGKERKRKAGGGEKRRMERKEGGRGIKEKDELN
jgi:hypothetical protein